MINRFAVILKRLREDNKLTQTQLAQKLELTQRKISYLENQVIEPDMDTLILIVKYFEVTTGYLLALKIRNT